MFESELARQSMTEPEWDASVARHSGRQWLLRVRSTSHVFFGANPFIPITILSDFVPGGANLEVDSLRGEDIGVGE